MTDLPFMPIATDSFVADASHMSAEQFGAYVRILVALWRNNGELYDHDSQLAHIAGVSGARWKKIAPVVTAGMVRQRGRIFSEKILKHLHETRERSLKKRVAAQERWKEHNRLKLLGTPNASAYADGLHNGVHFRSNHNHNHNQNHNYNHHHNHHHNHNGRASPGQQSFTTHPRPSSASTSADSRPIDCNTSYAEEPGEESAEELESRRRLFQDGLSTLQEISGQPEKICRSELKRLLKTPGSSCKLLIELCQRAKDETPENVLEWLSDRVAVPNHGGRGYRKK